MCMHACVSVWCVFIIYICIHTYMWVCDRDADKPLAAATSWKQESSTPRDVPQRKSDKENVNESMTSQKDVDSDKVSVGSVEAKKKKKSPPVSFSSLSIQRHNVAQLNKHTALMQLNKQERRKVCLTCSACNICRNF